MKITHGNMAMMRSSVLVGIDLWQTSHGKPTHFEDSDSVSDIRYNIRYKIRCNAKRYDAIRYDKIH